MNKPWSGLLTILGVIVSIVIAWWVVNILFSLIYLVVRIAIVGVVALLVFFALRGLLFGRKAKEGKSD